MRIIDATVFMRRARKGRQITALSALGPHSLFCEQAPVLRHELASEALSRYPLIRASFNTATGARPGPFCAHVQLSEKFDFRGPKKNAGPAAWNCFGDVVYTTAPNPWRGGSESRRLTSPASETP
jgi:hypothetical protein